MASPSWLSGMYGPLSAGPVPTPTPPASLTVLAPQQGPIPSSPPPAPAVYGEERRTPSVF